MQPHTPVFLTTVIPAFNEGERLPPYLLSLAQHLVATPGPSQEIIVVDDGSTASHADREELAVTQAQALVDAHPDCGHRFRFHKLPRNGGKGTAIRAGWEQAAPTTWLAFVDADGSISAPEYVRLVGLLASNNQCDVLAGSRIKMAGRLVDRVLFRHIQGRVFATLVNVALDLGIYDTQCGVKFYRAAKIQPILPALQESGWLLDIELFAYLKRSSANIVEVPIDWKEEPGSKIVFFDLFRMLDGLQNLRRRLARGTGT